MLITDTNLGVGPVEVGNPIEFGPGPVKIHPVLDTSSKRETPLDLNADPDFGIDFKRAFIDVGLGIDGGIRITLPPLKRGTVDSASRVTKYPTNLRKAGVRLATTSDTVTPEK